MTWTAFKEDWTSPTMLSAPYAYIYLAMVLGSALLCLTFVLRTILIFKGAEPEALK
jgi:TRAP-type C4-dicarboxylate transport system permease small subunit